MAELALCVLFAIGCSGKTPGPGHSGDSGSGGDGSQGLGGAGESAGGIAGRLSDSGDSGDDEASRAGASGEQAATHSDATALCKQLTTTLCTRAPQCSTGPEQGVCESQLSLEFGCDWATSPDYSACQPASEAQSCDALFPAGDLTLPDSCLPPITATPLSDAQTKCYALVDALCVHGIQCLGRVATSSYLQDCEDDVTTDLQRGLPCLLARAVGAGYAQCIAAIPGFSCGSAGSGGSAGNTGSTVMVIPACADALTFAP